MSKNLVFTFIGTFCITLVACTQPGGRKDAPTAEAEAAPASSRQQTEAAPLSPNTLQSSGIQRSYLLYRPVSLQTSNTAAPAVFVLHGSTGTSADTRKSIGEGFERLADQQGFVVVYPDGFERHWNDCRGSADYSANTENIDDPTFFRNLIGKLTDENIIDPEQAFVTGLSNGGQMAMRLAMETPSLFKAYAPVIASLPEERNLDCVKTNTPVSMLIMNGTLDPINPFKGGIVSIGENSTRGPVSSSRETALYWAGLAGNRRPPVTTKFPERDGKPETFVTEKRWEKGNGYRISLITMHGSGHVFPMRGSSIPEAYAKIVGPAAGDIDGSAEIVRFFFED